MACAERKGLKRAPSKTEGTLRERLGSVCNGLATPCKQGPNKAKHSKAKGVLSKRNEFLFHEIYLVKFKN
jgi:hypothetical protein